MGIRVVQRALAPPSPRQFNLYGPSAFSTKDRSKRKTPFSCKFGQDFKAPTAAATTVPDERRTSLFQQQATIEENEPPLPTDENRKPDEVNYHHKQCEIHVNGDTVEDKPCLNEQMERVSSDHEVNGGQLERNRFR